MSSDRSFTAISSHEFSSFPLLTSLNRYDQLASAASQLPDFSSSNLGLSSFVREENRRRLVHSASAPSIAARSAALTPSLSSSPSSSHLSLSVDLFHTLLSSVVSLSKDGGNSQEENKKEKSRTIQNKQENQKKQEILIEEENQSQKEQTLFKRRSVGFSALLNQKLEFYRNDSEAREALDRRVLMMREQKLMDRMKLSQDGKTSLEKNKSLAALYTSDFIRKLRRKFIEKEKIRENQAKQKKKQREIELLKLSEIREREILQENSPELIKKLQAQREELVKTKKFQLAWIMMSQLVTRTRNIKQNMKYIIDKRIENETEQLFTTKFDSIYYNSLTWQQLNRRETARMILERSLTRYARKWKFRRQRAAALDIWKLLTLVKAAQAIRQGLKDSSVRSQIVKIQSWWRRILKIIIAQRNLIEVKWLRREQLIARQTARKNQERRRSLAGHSGIVNNIGGLSISPMSGLQLVNRRNLLTGQDFLSSPIRTANSGKKVARGIDLDMTAYKPVPKSYRKQTIAQLVASRRSSHRAKLRMHFKALQRFHQLHSHEIELARARADLGMKNEWMKVPKEPEAPRMIHIPPNEELDAAIEAASKSFYLTKLQSKLSENEAPNKK
jgi:hypothetical protein